MRTLTLCEAFQPQTWGSFSDGGFLPEELCLGVEFIEQTLLYKSVLPGQGRTDKPLKVQRIFLFGIQERSFCNCWAAVAYLCCSEGGGYPSSCNH